VATHKTKTPFELTQLSRIDFKQKIDSVEASKIKAFVAMQEGVTSTYFNLNDGILVYTYQLEKQNSLSIYNKLINEGHYHAERYLINEADSKKWLSCWFW
jgi:hypothetical protein